SLLLVPPLRHLFFCDLNLHRHRYTLSLHDALPIWGCIAAARLAVHEIPQVFVLGPDRTRGGDGARSHLCAASAIRTQYEDLGNLDRKSTRLNSSHDQRSYAVFCLKKKI